MTAEDVKKLLRLEPHPREGGWYVRTYESGEAITLDRYNGARHTSTAIYYLLEPDTFSEMHALRSDEIFHHYLGDPVEMLQLHEDGRTSVHVIGKDLAAGQTPQLVVPRGVWQGSRLLHPAPEAFALLGCTVSPGFEFQDYKDAPRSELVSRWPQEAERITALTHSESAYIR
ncbi:MAG: cupin domain-containing protein [Acidobacteriaceae bacterium]|nr:cupin domain-containing protein [Acidobacteriaceae bacterium]